MDRVQTLASFGWIAGMACYWNPWKSLNLHANYQYENIIEDMLKKCDVPFVLDFLSSDMDSDDYFVLGAILESFKPTVVTTKYYQNWPVD